MRLPELRAFFVVFSDWTIANSLYPRMRCSNAKRLSAFMA